MKSSRRERRALKRLHQKQRPISNTPPEVSSTPSGSKRAKVILRTLSWVCAAATALVYWQPGKSASDAPLTPIAPQSIQTATLPHPVENADLSSQHLVVPSGGQLTFETLLERPIEEINQMDIATLNLLCASGLPGAEGIDIPKSLALLDEWTESVKVSIAKNQHRFWSNPAEYRHSESLFKMVMLVLTLQQDLKVHYDRTMMGAAIISDDPEAIRRDLADQSYFQDSKSIFLDGILSEERRGTCSSMPVLYVAIARRLGFPVKLVTTMGHLFVRWEGNGERFNIEGTGDGVDSPSDEHYNYMKWPLPVSEEAVAKGLYLKSLSPAEELAVFLESRAICLKENQQTPEAMVAIAQANRLRPNHFNTEVGLADITGIETIPVAAREPTPR